MTAHTETNWPMVVGICLFAAFHRVVVIGALRARDRKRLTAMHKNAQMYWLWRDRSLWRFFAAQTVVSIVMISGAMVIGFDHLVIEEIVPRTPLVTHALTIAYYSLVVILLLGIVLFNSIVVMGRPRFLMPRFLWYFPPKWDAESEPKRATETEGTRGKRERRQ